MDSGYIFKVEPSRLPYGQVVGCEGRKQVKMTLRVSSLAAGKMDEVATTMIREGCGWHRLGARARTVSDVLNLTYQADIQVDSLIHIRVCTSGDGARDVN